MKITLIEFFIRTIPETFVIIWGIYVISREHFNLKNYLILVGINSFAIFFIRKLPIYFGAHMILNIIVIIHTVIIFGISIIKTIYSTLIVSILIIISEILNLLILTKIHIEINSNVIDPIIKVFLGLPSLVILLVMIFIIKYILKKKGNKNVSM